MATYVSSADDVALILLASRCYIILFFFTLINKIINVVLMGLLGKTFIEMFYALYQRDISGPRGYAKNA
jgi:hypothetical protein